MFSSLTKNYAEARLPQTRSFRGGSVHWCCAAFAQGSARRIEVASRFARRLWNCRRLHLQKEDRASCKCSASKKATRRRKSWRRRRSDWNKRFTSTRGCAGAQEVRERLNKKGEIACMFVSPPDLPSFICSISKLWPRGSDQKCQIRNSHEQLKSTERFLNVECLRDAPSTAQHVWPRRPEG